MRNILKVIVIFLFGSTVFLCCKKAEIVVLPDERVSIIGTYTRDVSKTNPNVERDSVFYTCRMYDSDESTLFREVNLEMHEVYSNYYETDLIARAVVNGEKPDSCVHSALVIDSKVRLDGDPDSARTTKGVGARPYYGDYEIEVVQVTFNWFKFKIAKIN